MLESAARECEVSVRSCSLADEGNWADLCLWLAEAATTPCWVVLKNCHHCNGFSSCLKKLAKVKHATSMHLLVYNSIC